MNLEQAVWLIPLTSELSSIYGDLLSVKHYYDSLYDQKNVTYFWKGLEFTYYPKESLQFNFHIFDKNLFVSCSDQISSMGERLDIDFTVKDYLPVRGDAIGSAWLMGFLGVRLGRRESSLNQIIDLARLFKTAKPPPSDPMNREQNEIRRI